MLRSCCSAMGLMLGLLSAHPASAVRAIVQLKQCGYKSLLEAKVTNVMGGVKVKVCGEEVVLKKEQTQTDAWRFLNWWDPAQKGEKLSDEDLKTLDDYLGDYEYSRPIGQIGHGMLPPNFEGFRIFEGTTSAMVQGIFKFEVSLGNALNRLPTTSTAQLYRGGWTPSEQLKEMQAALGSGSAISFPWFQSTTTDDSHAYKFMGRKSEPETCAYDCIGKGEAFPTYLTFETCHGKNVTEWNAAEMEWLLLPGLRFKLVSITKVINDPWQEATPQDMAEWLRQSHTMPTKDWGRNGKMTFGPWPDIADAVLAHSIDGPAFIKWWESRSFPEPYVKGKWDESEYLYSDKHMEFQSAANTRFKLPRISTRMGEGPNTVEYYYRINLQDAEPC